MRHAATAGRFGASPGTAVEVFDDSGFAVIKVPWPRRLRGAAPPSHLVLQAGTTDASAGHHGPVITWHDRGLRLLVEPGPPLDHVDHPAARYADDPASHNTVILGGGSDRSMAGEVVRFGSHRNRFHLQARVCSDDTTHDRTIVLDPGRWLLVLDRVDGAADDDVGVRFHLGDELDLLPSADGFTLLAGPEPVAWAVPLGAGTAMIPERGRVEPDPSGWWSPDGLRMVPNWVLGWDARGATTFATVISLEGRPIRDEVDGPWIGWHTATRRVRIAVTEWGVSDVIVEPVRKKEVR